MKKRLQTVMIILSICLVFSMMALSPVSADDVTTITYWHTSTGWGGTVQDEMVANFNKTHPHIKVEVVRVPSIHVADISKLLAAITAGVGPDVYFVDRFTVAQRAHEGILMPLDSYFERFAIDPAEKYLDFVLPECEWQGQMYAVPFDTDLRALYYRKDHFREVGLDPDRFPVTIEELDQYADKLTQVDARGRLQRVGFVPWLGQGSVFTWSVVWGAEWYNPETGKIVANNPTLVSVLEWYRRYVERYPDLLTFVGSFGEEALDPFLTGQVSMVVQGDWNIGFINTFKPDLEYGYGPIPRPAEFDEPATWSGGWAMGIPQGSRHPEEAFEFMMYMTGYEGSKVWTEKTTHLPINRKVFETTPLRDDPSYVGFMDLLPYSTTRPPLPVWGLMWPEQHAVRDYVIYGQKEPRQALDDMVEMCQRELDALLCR